MMKKKWLVLGLVAALLCALLSGCGGAAKNEASYSYAAQEMMADTSDYAPAAAEEAWLDDGAWANGDVLAPAEIPMPSESAAESFVDSAEPRDPAKLIYTADLSMETLEFDAAVASLERLTAACGGYFESSTVSDQSAYRWAEYTIRVPAAQYRTFLDKAGETCHVLRRNEYTEDVSEKYYDTSGRLETQKTKLARLQALLLQAGDMEDIITIESAISETEEMIDRLSGTLRRYDALVDYSTVTVDLREVKVYEPEPDPTFGRRLGAAFVDGLKGFAEGLGDILIALAYSWLWLLLLAGIIVLILWLTRHRRAARRAARAEKKARRSEKTDGASYSTPAEEKQSERQE